MASSLRKPVIGIPADRRMIGRHPFHAVGEKYIAAVVQAADCGSTPQAVSPLTAHAVASAFS